MSNLKCPFCQQELKKHLGGDMPEVWCCDNEKCKLQTIGGDIELWQELIRTHKALDVALDWLEQVATLEKCDDDLCREFTKRKLIEIKTSLEQKEQTNEK